MNIIKVSLPIIQNRFPSILERFLLGIICIGFCDGNSPLYIDSCMQCCIKPLYQNKNLPPKRNTF